MPRENICDAVGCDPAVGDYRLVNKSTDRQVDIPLHITLGLRAFIISARTSKRYKGKDTLGLTSNFLKRMMKNELKLIRDIP